jgi:hypothetical protein
MPTKTIPQLPAAGAASLADLLDASQGGVEVHMTLQQVATLMQANVGGPLSGSGSPVGAVTPAVIGQTYFDTTTPAFWAANGLTNGSWTQIA